MRIAELLEEEGVEYDMEAHATTYTARQLAVAEQARPHQVIKPVLIEADEEPVLCALPADRRVDLEAVRSILGCERVRLATEDELAAACPNCEVGAEPPVGRLFGLPTLVDESVRDEAWVFFQSGTHAAAVLMTENDYERVAQAPIGRFTLPE